MKIKIGFGGQLNTRNVLDDINFAVKNNFNWFEIDLSWKQNYSFKPKTVKKIKEISEKNDLKLIVHTPYYLPTSTMIPEIKKGLIANVKKAIILAKKVGADRLTIHPGYREIPEPAINLCYKSLINNLKEIVKIGKDYKIKVCLENLDKNIYLLCSEIKEFSRVLNSVKGLFATLDVGHANTTSLKPFKYFINISNFVMDVHIHDNLGKIDEHRCLGEGNIDFIKFLKECKKTRYNGPFILEIFPYENILKGKKILIDLWNKA